MSKFYDALVNTDDGRKICIKYLNEQGITTPEDATLHQVAANIQLGVNGIDMWDTTKPLTDKDFKNAIKTIPLLDTSKITNMEQMFYGCYSLTTIPKLDTSNVKYISQMFQECKSLTTIPQLDTSQVIDMNYMFSGCRSLTTIPQLDISKVTNMGGMFSDCESLREIDISLAPILPNCNMSQAFNSIPQDCLIKVYDEASKQMVLKSRSDLTNVVVTGGK